MFRCSDTTFVTFENRKFLFSRLTLFLLYLYSVFKVQVVLKVWSFKTEQWISFTTLRWKMFAPQTCLKPLDFFRFTKKTIRITAWYSCVCSANSLCNLLLPCLASDAFQHKSQTVFSPLFSIERRWSSRTFRYGYLVTTSPQSLASPSAAPSLRLGHRLRVLPTPMVWRAVCTRPGNVFTATFWFAITSDSSFM